MFFYLGTHRLSHCRNFSYSFVSVNILRRRKANFAVNNWIMDSGAFTEVSTYGGYRDGVSEYAELVERWGKCGNMEFAVAQDYMCEPFILAKTGMSVFDHQRLTIQRYDELVKLTGVPILPVLQGYEPLEYVRHLDMYSDRLSLNMRVGVGSICKRNTNIGQIVDVLETIKDKRPDLRLHGFGLKTTALASNYVVALLYSADSMAWSYAARREGRDPNGLGEALQFVEKIKRIQGQKPWQLRLGVL